MGFSRQDDWSGLPFPLPGNLPDPGIDPVSPALQVDSLLLSHQGILILYTNTHTQTHTHTHTQWNTIQPLKMKKILPFTTGMDLESAVLSEVNQTRQIPYDFTYT